MSSFASAEGHTRPRPHPTIPSRRQGQQTHPRAWPPKLRKGWWRGTLRPHRLLAEGGGWRARQLKKRARTFEHLLLARGEVLDHLHRLVQLRRVLVDGPPKVPRVGVVELLRQTWRPAAESVSRSNCARSLSHSCKRRRVEAPAESDRWGDGSHGRVGARVGRAHPACARRPRARQTDAPRTGTLHTLQPPGPIEHRTRRQPPATTRAERALPTRHNMRRVRMMREV